MVRGAYDHGRGRYLRRELLRRLKCGPELEPTPRGTGLPYGSFYRSDSRSGPFPPSAWNLVFASVRAGRPSSMLPRM